MLNYAIRRLLFALAVIWAVYSVTFCLAHVEMFNPMINLVEKKRGIPESKWTKLGMADPIRLMMGQHGDVNTVERIREERGLNDPLFLNLRAFRTGSYGSLKSWGGFFSDQRHKTQYFRSLFNLVLNGDMGKTMRKRESVSHIIFTSVRTTAKLALCAIVIAMTLGLSLGVLSAVYQNTWIDRMAMLSAIVGISVPVYLVGLLMILVFVKHLRWIPGIGMDTSILPYMIVEVPWFIFPPGWTFEFQVQTWLILPALALGVRPGAALARMMRTTMLEVIRQDYVRTARAKGLSEFRVILKHAARNALIPVVTVLGLELAMLLTGAILTETVFALPGLGFQAYSALKDLDQDLIMGTVLFVSSMYVLANLIVDLSYAFLDPRIRYS